MKFALDAMGGDQAPYAVVQGALDAINRSSHLLNLFCYFWTMIVGLHEHLKNTQLHVQFHEDNLVQFFSRTFVPFDQHQIL